MDKFYVVFGLKNTPSTIKIEEIEIKPTEKKSIKETELYDFSKLTFKNKG